MRRNDPAKTDLPNQSNDEWICSVCGCVAAQGHACDKKRLRDRDAAMRRDDDAITERQRSYGERLASGFEMLEDDDYGDDE